MLTPFLLAIAHAKKTTQKVCTLFHKLLWSATPLITFEHDLARIEFVDQYFQACPRKTMGKDASLINNTIWIELHDITSWISCYSSALQVRISIVEGQSRLEMICYFSSAYISLSIIHLQIKIRQPLRPSPLMTKSGVNKCRFTFWRICLTYPEHKRLSSTTDALLIFIASSSCS